MGKKPSLALLRPSQYFLGEPQSQPALGIMYLAAQIRKHGYETTIYDFSACERDKYDLSKVEEYDIYGVTATYLDYDTSEFLCRQIKLKYPNAKCIIGGMIMNNMEYHANREVFDTTFVNDSEWTILDYLKDVETGIPKKTYVGRVNKTLDDIPFPARDLIQVQGSESIFYKKKSYYPGGTTSMIMSRGCVGQCNFCSEKFNVNFKLRFRSPENIKAEIEECIKNHGIHQMRMQDDDISMAKPFITKVLPMLKSLPIAYRVSCRVDKVTPDFFKQLVESNCKEIGFGLESGDDETLKTLGKFTTAEQNYNACKWAKEAGLIVRGFMMFGVPGENKDNLKRTYDFLTNVKPYVDLMTVCYLVPFPDSDFFRNPEKFNIEIRHKEFAKYMMTYSGDGFSEPSVRLLNVSWDEQLENKRMTEKFLRENFYINTGVNA